MRRPTLCLDPPRFQLAKLVARYFLILTYAPASYAIWFPERRLPQAGGLLTLGQLQRIKRRLVNHFRYHQTVVSLVISKRLSR